MTFPDPSSLDGRPADLRTEVERFRRWAETRPGQQFGEWEVEYEDWPSLWRAAEAALDATPDEGTIQLLLFAMGRDNECQVIRKMLVKRPEIGLSIARAALACADRDARWQSAVVLGTQRNPEAVDLLRRFATDSDEYVRRRALWAIVPLDREFAETVAYSWLDAEDDYSRFAALVILDQIGSVLLSEALTRLRLDKLSYTREKVREIEARRS